MIVLFFLRRSIFLVQSIGLYSWWCLLIGVFFVLAQEMEEGGDSSGYPTEMLYVVESIVLSKGESSSTISDCPKLVLLPGKLIPTNPLPNFLLSILCPYWLTSPFTISLSWINRSCWCPYLLRNPCWWSLHCYSFLAFQAGDAYCSRLWVN